MDLNLVAGFAAWWGIWLGNGALAFALLVAPRRGLAFLTRTATKDVNWLRVLGILILGNTVFSVLAAHIAGMYGRAVMELTGMAR